MPIAREGAREIILATVILAGLAGIAAWQFWPAIVPLVVVWLWVLWFFRDPARRGMFEPGDLCSAADGRVTEITYLDDHDATGGPAVRIGVFLSLFNVHINRAPCTGRITSVAYKAGEFFDARHPESGRRNESNTLLIDPSQPMPGPVEVRQVAGMLARRIVCHATEGESLAIGARFGLIKFGSRTELVIPRLPDTEIKVSVGDKVHAGLTVVARQPVASECTEAPTPRAAHGVQESALVSDQG